MARIKRANSPETADASNTRRIPATVARRGAAEPAAMADAAAI